MRRTWWWVSRACGRRGGRSGSLACHGHRAPRTWLVGPSVLVLAARCADDLHWRLSRDEFEAVLNGGDVPCSSEGDCRLGWWKSYGEERIESMVIVWIPDEFCYAGLGIAHPVGDDPGKDGMAEAHHPGPWTRRRGLPAPASSEPRWLTSS